MTARSPGGRACCTTSARPSTTRSRAATRPSAPTSSSDSTSPPSCSTRWPAITATSPPDNPYTPLIAAADAISASRPGARRETLERYIKRLEKLEEIATSFKGVESAYAIQAGREIRVIVDANQIDDESAMKVARDIANKVEQEMTYPGEIQVTLLREVRCIEYAK